MTKLKLCLFFITIFGLALPLKSEKIILSEGEIDISNDIRIAVNKLGSTSQLSEQTMGMNKLIGFGGKAVPYLNVYLINDKRTFNRIKIAEILGKIRDESAIPALLEASKSKYPALNKAAIKAIGEIGGETALTTLKALQTSTTDQILLNAIQGSLKKISPPQKK